MTAARTCGSLLRAAPAHGGQCLLNGRAGRVDRIAWAAGRVPGEQLAAAQQIGHQARLVPRGPLPADPLRLVTLIFVLTGHKSPISSAPPGAVTYRPAFRPMLVWVEGLTPPRCKDVRRNTPTPLVTALT
jgi:hypothetical protein